MANTLFRLSVKCKRDVLRLRQLTGQAAGLLGFDARDQVCLAAAAFDLACQAREVTGRAAVCFELEDDCLQVVFEPKSKRRRSAAADEPRDLRLHKRLPATASVPREDIPWMVHRLMELTPLDLFDEIKKINQDLLSALLDLGRQQEGAQDQKKSSAA